jgi:pyridoxal/pyridoxine/pyridoxamine kinase
MFTDVTICLGYVGSKSFLEEVVNVLSDLRKVNPNLVFGMAFIFIHLFHACQMLQF